MKYSSQHKQLSLDIFHLTLFVTIRKRIGKGDFNDMSESLVKLQAKKVGEKNEVKTTFGTGKRIYRANNIRAKLPDKGETWTSACYFSRNVMKFFKEFLHLLTDIQYSIYCY